MKESSGTIFSVQDGGSLFFRNVGTSSLTKRCHISEDHNLNRA